MSTKASFINSLAVTLGLTKKAATNVFNVISDITFASLAEHSQAMIPGVGRLKLNEKAPRMGRNPKTGEAVPISKRTVLKLSTSKMAKTKINTK